MTTKTTKASPVASAPIASRAGGPAAAPDTPASSAVITVTVAVILAGLQAFLAVFQPALTALIGLMPKYVAGVSAKVIAVRSDRAAAVPLIATLFENHPDLAPKLSPTALTSASSTLTLIQKAIGLTKELLASLEYTERVAFAQTWQQADTVYRQAKTEAVGQSTMAAAIEPIVSLFARGSKVASSTSVADKTARAATAADEKATAAHQKANEANATVARVTAARNAQHPKKGDATIVTPTTAPTASSESTAPATAPATATGTTTLR